MKIIRCLFHVILLYFCLMNKYPGLCRHRLNIGQSLGKISNFKFLLRIFKKSGDRLIISDHRLALNFNSNSTLVRRNHRECL